jgi:two-component system, OmpR family, phosphate regulon sensor histidine kinase PhoR
MTVRLLELVRSHIALKLTLTLVGFVAVTMLVAGFYLARALETFAAESLEARLASGGRLLVDEARGLLASGADADTLRAFVVRAAGPTESRITLIDLQGRVVADSEVAPSELSRLENHARRREVRAALAGQQGHDLRRSATLGAPLLYVALPVGEPGRRAGVLRLALPLSAVTSSYAAVHRVMLIGGGIAVLVAFGIGVFVARRVTEPVVEMQRIARRMSDGDFAVAAPVRSVDEIGALGRALNVMAGRLRAKIRDLEQEQAKATAILDGMVEGVVAVDGHDAILLMNESARAIFQLDRGRGEHKPFLEVLRNADLHAILRESRAAGEDEPVRRELRLSTPVERFLRVSAVPLRLDRDEVGVVMVLHDVTELRRLEQVRTEFVANVSHELRTPLTAIQGYLETLLGGALEEPQNARPFLDVVFRHTERLGRLLADLTDLSNIELGKTVLRRQPTIVAEVVDSTLAIIAPRAQAGGVALSRDLPPDLPRVLADHDRLAQILINLADNAVKYTPRGGRVTLTGRARGATVEVAVSDTGIGIPPGDLPRITERFYRVDRARSRELGGTGLGLAIVKHLVLAHGGELAIESEPGTGTTVRFTLPAA